MNTTALILMGLILCISTYTSLAGKKQYTAMLADGNRSRALLKLYRTWIVQLVVVGIITIIGLMLLRHGQDIFAPITQDGSIGQMLEKASSDEDDRASTIIGIVVALVVVLPAVTYMRAKQAVKKGVANTTVDPLLPKTPQQRKMAAAMAFAAGISEELYFRALLPAVFYALSGSVNVAVAISTLIFGLEHIYQGWKGVVATAFAGFVFYKVFVLFGSVLAPIALHIIIDLNSLVFMPYLVRRAKAAVSHPHAA